MLATVALALVVVAGLVAFVKYVVPHLGDIGELIDPPTPTPSSTPSPSPTPTPPPWLNPILEPRSLDATPGAIATVDATALPAQYGLLSEIFDKSGKIASYLRPYELSFGDPLDYGQASGVLTFRGNNFRSSGAFGLVDLREKTMAQVWERPVGSLASSSWSFSWTGTGWTGQPIIVEWSDEVREMMNLNPDKKAKKGLKEVIYATMDGNVYFFDLDDGKDTRPAIRIGASIKGTPAVDPRGWPILYVGQGDFQPKGSAKREVGFRIFSLIDQKLLYFQNTIDTRAYRQEWGALDSSPIVDGKTDTLLWCCENGLVYTAKLNTVFDRTAKTVSIAPDFTVLRYKSKATRLQGVESSPSVYGRYAYFNDNSGILNCLDLMTMQPVWMRPLEDDSDVTTTLDYAAGQLALYTGTEIDWQKDIVGNYLGDAYVYRIDPLTGATVWKSSYPCWTKNAANSGDDINGGCLGSPVVGRKKMSDLVVFSFCMTNGVYSGNSLVAFRKDNGAIAWEYRMKQYSWSSPVAIYDKEGNPYLVVADSIGQLHLVDGLTGQRLFYLQMKKNLGTDKEQGAGNTESTCAIFGNQLVVGTRGNVIVGVTLK